MRYYVFVVSISASGENRETFGYNDRDSAIQKYHSVMSSAMAGSVINKIDVWVSNSVGGLEIPRNGHDSWTRPVVEEVTTTTT